MKVLLVSAFLRSGLTAGAQEPVQDLTKATNNGDRAAILNALRITVAKELKQEVKFSVDRLKVSAGYAVLHGRTRSATGGDIDFSKVPAYRDAVKAGLFDGDGTVALLKKTTGGWRYVTHVIGPTDVAWACWWKEYHAPKIIFDGTEACSD